MFRLFFRFLEPSPQHDFLSFSRHTTCCGEFAWPHLNKTQKNAANLCTTHTNQHVHSNKLRTQENTVTNSKTNSEITIFQYSTVLSFFRFFPRTFSLFRQISALSSRTAHCCPSRGQQTSLRTLRGLKSGPETRDQ